MLKYYGVLEDAGSGRRHVMHCFAESITKARMFFLHATGMYTKLVLVRVC